MTQVTSDLELLPLTLTFNLNLVSVKVNQHAVRYLFQMWLVGSSNVVVRTLHTYRTDCSTWTSKMSVNVSQWKLTFFTTFVHRTSTATATDDQDTNADYNSSSDVHKQ